MRGVAIRFETSSDGEKLVVRAAGFDESLEEVQAYGLGVIEAAVAGAFTRILCDERELEYRLKTVDTFQAAEFIAAAAPRVARIAIVCHPGCMEDAAFWETVAVNRGLSVRMFRGLDEATRWLDELEAAGPSLRLGSLRLSLVAATLRHLEAELTGPRSLSLLLGAAVPASWPPGEYDRHAQEYFRDRLAAASPADAGWFGWYGITPSAPFTAPTLVVAAGFVGPPGEDGTVETGYSVVPEARGFGYATEAVKSLRAWALRNGASRVIAHTTPANVASVKVLERCGFVEEGPGEEPGTVRFATGPASG